MQSVTYRLDQSPVTPFQYQQDVEKFAGNIECSECEASAWFVRGSFCSGQPIPDSGLSFSSATAGGNPSLN
ncbi:hypothetical protein IPC1221_32420 [Pseudomonas aeruginosa]|nr:hypothetical protein IPC1221_32420 [Pseudomonas aeruginosa]